MRDAGLHDAIQAAGGVNELARRIGISQPSVSSWDRVPAERVLAVEAATGVSRSVLRPDLYRMPGQERDEVDIARAGEYALLGSLLLHAPNAKLLDALAGVRIDASPLGMARAQLGQAARTITAARVEREFFDLFIGLGRGELLPYASYYLTGFLNERPLARLRSDLAPLGIVRAEGNPEPEDHLGTLCEIMAGLINEMFPAPPGTDERIFTEHLAPWAARFFADLERAQSADFYRHVGALGRAFMAIESEALALPE